MPECIRDVYPVPRGSSYDLSTSGPVALSVVPVEVSGGTLDVVSLVVEGIEARVTRGRTQWVPVLNDET